MSNPAMSERMFENITEFGSAAMTKEGTVLKSFLLVALVILGGSYSWGQFFNHSPHLSAIMLAGIIIAFILALIICFVKTTAPYLAPVYAVCEGVALGGFSAMAEAAFPGIVMQAVIGTLAVLFSMLALYSSRVIVVTEKLKIGILVATLAVAITYLVAFICSFFGINFSFLYDASPLSIGISLLVIGIASFNFLLDFDMIENGIVNRLPKYFEWYCSFGLLLTVVWVYIEILKLLTKLNRR